MDKDLVELKVAVSVMAERIEVLQETVDRQAKHIEELLELYNRGRGAAWILMGMGGIGGALATKMLPALSAVFR